MKTWLSELPRTPDLKLLIDLLDFYRPQGGGGGGGGHEALGC